MGGIWKDIGYGVRMLMRSPGFTATAMISLALGIGANTAIFSVVYAVLLRPFPVAEADRLVVIEEKREGVPMALTSYPNYRDIRDRCDAFQAVAASTQWPVSVKAQGKARIVLGKLVTGDYFSLLGVNAFLGRTIQLGDTAKPGEAAIAVISHRLWQSALGSDRDVIGGTILVNNRPFTLVGVAPAGFNGEMAGFAVDVWAPVTMVGSVLLADVRLENRKAGWLFMLARLRKGVTAGQADSAVRIVGERLKEQFPDANRGASYGIVSGSAARFPVPALGRAVAMLLKAVMAIVGFVLLIACSNLANLLMTRAVGREREIAIRLALGSGRRRIVRQLLIESLLLSLAAGVLGLLFAVWLVDLFAIPKPPSPLPIELTVGLEPVVLAFTLVVSIAAALVFGTFPAVQASGVRLLPALGGSRTSAASGPGKARLQTGLVVVQVAVSLMLLAGTGLLAKSVRAASTLDPGFEISRGIVVDLNLAYGRYTEQQGRVFYQRLIEEVEGLPGVEAASLALFPPLNFAKETERISIDGYQPGNGMPLFVDSNYVGPAYFRTLGIPIVSGRAFTRQDDEDSEDVVIVNETMAKRFWAGRDPLGLSFTMAGERVRIVGIAKDSKWFMLSETPQPFAYRAFLQNYAPLATLHVRTAGNPNMVMKAVLGVIDRLDPNLPLSNARTMERHMTLSRYPTTIAAMMAGGFGVLALVLAIVGVYGVMSYSVGRRVHEFGIRAALGASRNRIIASVLRHAFAVAAGGATLGLAGAYVLGGALSKSGVLVDVQANDLTILIGASLVALAATITASFVPVRAATVIPPSDALRHE